MMCYEGCPLNILVNMGCQQLPNSKKNGASLQLQEEGYPELHKGTIEKGVGPLQPKKHIPPKWVY